MDLACDLNAPSPEERLRHEAVFNRLRALAAIPAELPDGFAVQLPPLPKLLQLTAEFISLERQGCPFLTLTLEGALAPGLLAPHFAGPAGVLRRAWGLGGLEA